MWNNVTCRSVYSMSQKYWNHGGVGGKTIGGILTHLFLEERAQTELLDSLG